MPAKLRGSPAVYSSMSWGFRGGRYSQNLSHSDVLGKCFHTVLNLGWVTRFLADLSAEYDDEAGGNNKCSFHSVTDVQKTALFSCAAPFNTSRGHHLSYKLYFKIKILHFPQNICVSQFVKHRRYQTYLQSPGPLGYKYALFCYGIADQLQ